MLPQVARVLRFHEEPCTHLDDHSVHAAFEVDPGGLLDHLDAGIRKVASGRYSVEQPSKQIFRDPGEHSDFRVMSCVVRGSGHVRKTVKIVGTNTRGSRVPDQLTVGRALTLDADENFVTGIIDACALSSMRTGAVAALAARYLAPDRGRVTLHGCGRVGFYAARLLAAAGGVNRLRLTDPIASRVDDMIAALETSPGMPELSEASGHEEADVVVLATDSETPLSCVESSPAVVISVGADTEWQRELPERLAARGHVCVDSLDSLATGDLADWTRKAAIDAGGVVELIDVLRHESGTEHPSVFVSTGSALFDNLAIDWLLSGKGA